MAARCRCCRCCRRCRCRRPRPRRTRLPPPHRPTRRGRDVTAPRPPRRQGGASGRRREGAPCGAGGQRARASRVASGDPRGSVLRPALFNISTSSTDRVIESTLGNVAGATKLAQQHREFYRDKSGTLYPVPYFVLPQKEKERCPHPLDLPPLSAKTRWHLLRLSSLDVRTCQTFPSGKRVPSKERQNRDVCFACRA